MNMIELQLFGAFSELVPERVTVPTGDEGHAPLSIPITIFIADNLYYDILPAQ